jgi:hypothetical protein
MTTIETPTVPEIRTAYFRSFLSYRIPFEPEGEISFAETERLGSYYVAHSGPDGRLRQFEKILLTRVQRLDSIVLRQSADQRRYFTVRRRREGALELGAQVTYAETERWTEFLQAEESQPGTAAELWLMRRMEVLRDRYSYWPTGVLRDRTLTRMDQSEVTWRYDEQGRVREANEGEESNEVARFLPSVAP